jgi:UDP-glucuronate decarboxylase
MEGIFMILMISKRTGLITLVLEEDENDLIMKRILVTGGAGFIGSHLCESLLNEGNEVICVDNFFTGNKKNIIHLKDNPWFEFIRHDIIMPLYAEVDEIYNLACPASPVQYQFNAIKTVKTSIMGSINLLGLAKRTGAKILQASTSEVYGDPKVHPQTEDYWGNVNPIGPRSCYDEGKRCAETLFMNYHKQNNVRIKIARIFNTYGPRMMLDDGRVVTNFCVQALKNKNITVFGDGSQSRSFQYIDDLITGLKMLMATDDGFIGPVNLGNPSEISILDMAKAIIKQTGSDSKITYDPLPEDDPMQRKPDITLAKNKLGWEPKVDLESGLNKTLEYFKEQITV